MNVSRAVDRRWHAARRRFDAARSVALRILFGTRIGLAIFLGTFAFAGLYWRVGVFITDNYTLANGLVALADGHLAVERAVYGPGLRTPGMSTHDGQAFARNYGQIAFALPFLWVLKGITALADPGVTLPMAWSLLVIALGREVGTVSGRPRLGQSAGAVCGLGVFLANAAVARPIAAEMLPLVALQTSALVATGLAAATLYRLITRLHGETVGVASGAALVAATPVGFWASIPKRHVYVVALLVGICYALFRSREATDADALLSARGFRALAYALVGLATWIHAGEAFVLFVGLVAVDVPTAPTNDSRTLAVVAGAFALSLLPFLTTNVLISGDPLRPPRMLRNFGPIVDDVGLGARGGASGTDSVQSWRSTPLPPAVAAVLSEGVHRADLIMTPFVRGSATILTEPGSVYRTFVRGGYVKSVASEDGNQAINLSVVEGSPLVGGTIAVLAVGGWTVSRRLRRIDPQSVAGGDTSRSRQSHVRQQSATDAFAVTCALLFCLIYLPRLPVHAQVTARYLLPLYPLALYGLARLASIRRVLATHGRLAAWAWGVGVLIGAQLFVLAVAAGSLGRGEAFQLHALAGLGVAALFAACASASVVTDRSDRATAVTGGLAAALGTDLILLSGFVYFQYGQYALPVSGELARSLPLV